MHLLYHFYFAHLNKTDAKNTLHSLLPAIFCCILPGAYVNVNKLLMLQRQTQMKLYKLKKNKQKTHGMLVNSVQHIAILYFSLNTSFSSFTGVIGRWFYTNLMFSQHKLWIIVLWRQFIRQFSVQQSDCLQNFMQSLFSDISSVYKWIDYKSIAIMSNY